MSNKKRVRGKRVHLELDEELSRVIDLSSKQMRLRPADFMRWTLARSLLGTQSLSALAVENAQ